MQDGGEKSLTESVETEEVEDTPRPRQGRTRTNTARPSQDRPVWNERLNQRGHSEAPAANIGLSHRVGGLSGCDGETQQAPTSGGAGGPSRRGAGRRGRYGWSSRQQPGRRPSLCRSPLPSEKLANANQGFISVCSMTKGLQGAKVCLGRVLRRLQSSTQGGESPGW